MQDVGALSRTLRLNSATDWMLDREDDPFVEAIYRGSPPQSSVAILEDRHPFLEAS